LLLLSASGIHFSESVLLPLFLFRHGFLFWQFEYWNCG
jgi:hypothetical protein